MSAKVIQRHDGWRVVSVGRRFVALAYASGSGTYSVSTGARQRYAGELAPVARYALAHCRSYASAKAAYTAHERI